MYGISRFLAVSQLFGFLLVTPALAQQRMVVHVTGATQGLIEGDSNFSQATGSIDAEEYHHLVTDFGGQSHREVIFTKRADKATVDLWEAFDNDEGLTVSIEYWDLVLGNYEMTMRVELQGATVFAIEPVFSPGQQLAERLRLRYASLTLTYWHVLPNGSLDTPESHTINGVFN